jgi:hypothetical protein
MVRLVRSFTCCASIANVRLLDGMMSMTIRNRLSLDTNILSLENIRVWRPAHLLVYGPMGQLQQHRRRQKQKQQQQQQQLQQQQQQQQQPPPQKRDDCTSRFVLVKLPSSARFLYGAET